MSYLSFLRGANVEGRGKCPIDSYFSHVGGGVAGVTSGVNLSRLRSAPLALAPRVEIR